MSTLVHYYTKAGVACGTPWKDVTEVTESFGLVTCFACRKSGVFRSAQAGTDGRPSDRTKLRRIKQVLAEWEQGVHPEADALTIIKDIIDEEGPSDG
jgi:hypothetical protein